MWYLSREFEIVMSNLYVQGSVRAWKTYIIIDVYSTLFIECKQCTTYDATATGRIDMQITSSRTASHVKSRQLTSVYYAHLTSLVCQVQLLKCYLIARVSLPACLSVCLSLSCSLLSLFLSPFEFFTHPLVLTHSLGHCLSISVCFSLSLSLTLLLSLSLSLFSNSSLIHPVIVIVYLFYFYIFLSLVLFHSFAISLFKFFTRPLIYCYCLSESSISVCSSLSIYIYISLSLSLFKFFTHPHTLSVCLYPSFRLSNCGSTDIHIQALYIIGP